MSGAAGCGIHVVPFRNPDLQVPRRGYHFATPNGWPGAEVRVPLSERAPLDPGEFFQSDLVGCQVVDRRTGEIAGPVTGWEDGGGAGLLVVDGGLMIPFARVHLRGDRSGGPAHRGGIAGRLEGSEPAVIFHVLTIFPEFFAGPFAHGVVKRAQDAGILDIRIHNLRDWTFDRHKTVDDRPFGGGEGMVLKPEPIFQAVESIWPERQPGRKVVLLSAQGRAVRPGHGQPPEPGSRDSC